MVERFKRPGKKKVGRPKGHRQVASGDQLVAISTLARKFTLRAINKMGWLIDHADSHAVQLAAAEKILERGYGKIPQALEHGGKDGGSIPLRLDALNDTQLDTLIKRLTTSES